MPDAAPIGERLRRLRRERSLTQEQLAERAGVSRELVSKLEQGTRNSARVSSLAALATALDVDLSDLLGKRPQLDPDGARVLGIRDALLTPGALPGIDPADDGEPTPLPDLDTAIRRAWDDYWTGRFGRLAASVPPLIGEARLTHSATGGAATQLARVYQLAACLLVHLGKDDLAALGTERALGAASGGDDELQWATLHGTYAWVLLHQGRLRESEDHAARIAARIEPALTTASPQHLVVWGGLLLTATAPAAADNRRKDAAEDYISLAGAAAARLGVERHDYEVSFGPTQVAMQTTHAYAVLREPGKAITASRTVQRANLRPVAYGRHLLDVGQAHVDGRHAKAATATLAAARNISPEWFRHQGIARSLVADLVETQRRLSPELRSLARTVNVR